MNVMKKIAIILSCCLSAIASNSYSQRRPTKFDALKTKWYDLPYASVSERNKLDIYLPDKGGGPFPAIIWVHGGGWSHGDKRNVGGNILWSENDFAVIKINYRRSVEAPFPAAIHDVKAAIRWVKANGTKYSIDTARLLIGGSSAGGHLSSLAATSAGDKTLEDLSMGNAEYSCDVKGCFDQWGPTNFLMMDEFFEKSGMTEYKRENIASSPTSKFIGGLITEHPDRVRAADPTTYISSETPPFFIVQGIEDRIVPAGMSKKFAEDLKAAIGEKKVKLLLIPGLGHNGTDPSRLVPDLYQQAIEFFRAESFGEK